MIDYEKTNRGDILKLVGQGAPGFGVLGDLVRVIERTKLGVLCENKHGSTVEFVYNCGAARLEPTEWRNDFPGQNPADLRAAQMNDQDEKPQRPASPVGCIVNLQNENEQLRRELAHAKRNEAATWEYHSRGFAEFTSHARILEDALWSVCRHMLPDTMHTPQRMATMQEPWRTAGEALLSHGQKERPANTPIDELVQKYADECCDFSDLEYVRRVSLRYVSTMEDGQVRCLLYVLATWPGLQANT